MGILEFIAVSFVAVVSKDCIWLVFATILVCFLILSCFLCYCSFYVVLQTKLLSLLSSSLRAICFAADILLLSFCCVRSKSLLYRIWLVVKIPVNNTLWEGAAAMEWPLVFMFQSDETEVYRGAMALWL